MNYNSFPSISCKEDLLKPNKPYFKPYFKPKDKFLTCQVFSKSNL